MSSLEIVLAESFLTTGPVRSPQEIAQLRRVVAQIVRKYFGTPAQTALVLEPSTSRTAAD